MIEHLIYTMVVCVGALFGAVAGRTFAIEAQSRAGALFAPAYVGAGVGLVSALPIGSLSAVAVNLLGLDAQLATLADVLNVTGTAILWGTASGAAGGLLVGLIVLAFNATRL